MTKQFFELTNLKFSSNYTEIFLVSSISDKWFEKQNFRTQLMTLYRDKDQ